MFNILRKQDGSGLTTIGPEMDRWINRFFDDFSTPAVLSSANWTPALDAYEKDGKYFVELEVPGLEPKDVDISVAGDTLTIKGEKVLSRNENSKDGFRYERAFGKFQRAITLPPTADANNVEAHYKNGLLTIEIGVREEVKPKTIPVKVK